MGTQAAVTIVPANEASCAEIDAIFGTRGYPARCRCQRFRTTSQEWWYDPIPEEERVFRLVTWGEMHVGHHNVFAAAGFKGVGRPSKRRVVMRIDF